MNNKIQRLDNALTPRLSRAALPAVSYEETVDAPEFSLREYWRILSRRRGSLAVALAFSLFGAALYTTMVAPTYRATATVQIDREQPGLADIRQQAAAEPLEQPDYLETQYKVLRSRTLAKRVIAELGIAGDPELTQDLAPGEAEAWGESLHPKILERFLERLSVRPSKGTRLVDVSYESIDPDLAPKVVNTLANAFVEYNLEARWQATEKASKWLQEQLAALERKLQTSESALQDYATRHSILFVEERKDITTEKLAQLEEELTRAESDRVQKQSFAMLATDVVERGAKLPGSLGSETYQALNAQLSELQRERSRLRVTFAEGYPSVRRVQGEIDQVEAALDAERDRILRSVNEGYEVARKREELLLASVDEQRAKVNRLSDDFIRYNILKRDAETNRELYEGLLQRLKEAGVSAGLRASNIAVLDPAEKPEQPYRPRPFVNYCAGLALGLVFGVALAFVREHLDTGMRTPEEVERLTGLALLAVIPRGRSKDDRKVIVAPPDPAEGEGALPHWDPEIGLAEAYRSLRSSLLLGWDDSMRRILLTSSQPQEGKTTISLNLACSLAQLGRRVVLVDADMRRPDCARQLGVESGQGLSEYLQGLAELDEAIRETSVPGLSLLSSGASTRVAADLLYSPRLAIALRELGERYDHVVIDSPPSLGLSDARTIGRMVEGVILVVSDRTESAGLSRTKQTFDEAGVRLLGFVMNRVSLHGDYGNYGYYYASSGDERPSRKRSSSRRAA
jgi:capsular exopolysaccharide synthesis family protein